MEISRMRSRLDFILPHALTDATIDSLHAIASESLDVERGWLGEKLRGFDRIILFRERRSGALVGCTGLRIIDCEHEGRSVRLIYTGAVFIAEAWRRQNLIQRAGLQSVLRFGLTRRRLYWLSECDSYRAYLVGARYMRDLWPRHDAQTPPFETGLMTLVCPRLFEDTWHPETWVCTAIAERRLKTAVGAVPEELRARDPHVGYFVTRNPRYLEGEGLTMLARVDLRNAVHWVARAMRRKPRARPAPVAPASAQALDLGGA